MPVSFTERWVNRVTEHALQAIPEADFISALIALTPHDFNVIAKPVVEHGPVLGRGTGVIAKTG